MSLAPMSRFKEACGQLLSPAFRRKIRPARVAVARFLVWLPIMRRWAFHVVTRPVPGTRSPRLVEQQFFLFGLMVATRRLVRRKIRVALLVDEFFGAWRTAIGGYGALARKYVAKYVPSDEIEIDVLLNTYGLWRTSKKIVDQTAIYKLSRSARERQGWLDEQGYDVFLSIEMTAESSLIFSEYKSDARMIYWVQDPRDLEMYQTRLRAVTRLRDDDWSYLRGVGVWVRDFLRQGRIAFISQGESLSEIVRHLYELPEQTPIKDLPNPVEIDFNYSLSAQPKRDKIIFLGRLEAQKRAWIFCEVAKRLPQYDFYVLGASGRNQQANARTLEEYREPDGASKIPNLHFTGHVDGEEKAEHIRSAKLLLNTSVWEGIPISWLEALSYGTLIVSAFERDSIVGRFGTYVGEISGNGTEEEDLQKLAGAVRYWIEHDTERQARAALAIEFVRSRHSIAEFQKAMREEILLQID